ncbi:hypothetical protein BCV70DRAFT_197183 [Testicularia cyperi]|uniref:Uncharacterized protein n=1 Tax=Testicularia cyperi TaxID=1882483 RepID=A0A317XXE1_9BASI|nr:hypothetical protein BCV70DRAFT_197183 [Testicularia cyperi]
MCAHLFFSFFFLFRGCQRLCFGAVDVHAALGLFGFLNCRLCTLLYAVFLVYAFSWPIYLGIYQALDQDL